MGPSVLTDGAWNIKNQVETKKKLSRPEREITREDKGGDGFNGGIPV